MKQYNVEKVRERHVSKTRREELSGITDGTFITVDPGTKFLGWAVVTVTKDGSAFLVDRGTIVREFAGTQSTAYIVDELFSVIENYSPDELIIEDYMFIRGKTNGMFAVPAIIGIIKYEWYRRTKKEAIVVKSQTWKGVICRSASAGKMQVREAMKDFLDPDEYESIIKEFSEKRSSRVSDYGEQDCIDAVAIGLYVCLMVLEEQRLAATAIF